MGLTHHRAGLTNFRAFLANVIMVRRTAAHEIGRNCTNLGAVQERDQMRRLRMMTTVVENVGCSGSTNLVAVKACFDAVSVLFIDRH